VATVVAFLAWQDASFLTGETIEINGLRFLMIGLIFLAAVINYIDRQSVSGARDAAT